MDIIHEGSIEDLLIFFPFVLIAVGIEKLATKTRFNFIAYLTSVALFAGGFLIVLTSSAANGFYDDFFSESTYRFDDDVDIERIYAVLDMGETDLKIRDSGNDLVYARFDKYIRKPEIETEIVDGILNINMNNRSGSLLGGIVKIESDENDFQDWYLRFSGDKPLDLECYGEGSVIHLNLATTLLENLKLDADDAQMYIKIGDLVSQVNVEVSGIESKLKLRIPLGSGLKILGPELEDYLIEFGLEERDDGYFVTEGFDSSLFKIDLKVDDRIDEFKIDYF